MVGGLLIAMKAIGIRGRGLFVFALGAREGADATLTDCVALHAVSTFSWGPFTLRGAWAVKMRGTKLVGGEGGRVVMR